MKPLGFVNFVLFEVKEAVASLEKQMSKVLGIQLPKLTLDCESDTRSSTRTCRFTYRQLYYWTPHGETHVTRDQEAKDAALQDITAMKAELDERRGYVLSLEGQVEQQTLDLLMKVSVYQFENRFLIINAAQSAQQNNILPPSAED